MAMFIVKPWYRKKDDAIYGAEWAGTSDPSWVRTDAAVGFSNPNPYYAGMSTTPSSPFDNIMPWSGIRRVTDASAGELVEIPKFYYKWTRDGVKMKLQISMSQFDGSHVSPAHADRGDGVGERDYVYAGRYHCASDYKSKTGVTPTRYVSRGSFRTSIHNLGSNVWQNDYAMRWTIGMLYLVEFAHWDSQTKIGYGSGNGSSVENMGYTDNMPYHTGTTRTSRTTYGLGTQYRYIEGLWDNLFDLCDGIYFSNANIYCIKNPADFAETGGTYVGTRTTNSNCIKSYTNPTAQGYEYALYVNEIVSDITTYTTDFSNNTKDGQILFCGGYWVNVLKNGLFTTFASDYPSFSGAYAGSRLMVLPPSRLSA